MGGKSLTSPDYMRELDLIGSVYLPQWCEGLSLFDAASTIGKVLDVQMLWPGAGASTIQRLEAREPNNDKGRRYSDIYGRKRFPFHTDLAHWAVPPRYLLLRCVKGAVGVSTGVLNSAHFLNIVGRNGAKRALFRSRNPVSNLSNGSVLPLLQEKDGSEIFRWDPQFLTPMNGFASELRDKILNGESECMRAAEYFSLQKPNDALVVDNWRFLHCRRPVPDGVERVIERVYLEELHTQ